MTKMVRTLNKTDAILIRVVLLNAGVKARVRVFPTSIRVVFDGAKEVVAEALNNEGYLHASAQPFGQFSFNGPNEVFVRYAA
jgi:hypothetical protein